MSKEKAVVETKKHEVAMPLDTFGAADEITANDITIGRIAVMQASSDLVKQDKARQGAIVNLVDGKELAYKTEKAMDFIPIKSYRYWIEKDADTGEFLGKFPATDPNEKPWNESVNGKNIVRTYNHAYIILLPEEIKEMNDMPIEISFRSTDLVTARKLNMFLLKLRKRNEPSWNRIFQLTTNLKTKDKFSWFSTDVSVGRVTTVDERKICQQWFSAISNTKGILDASVTDAVSDSDIPF